MSQETRVLVEHKAYTSLRRWSGGVGIATRESQDPTSSSLRGKNPEHLMVVPVGKVLAPLNPAWGEVGQMNSSGHRIYIFPQS